MPTAKKTKSGKFRVTVYDYKDSSGKVHQKTFTADTKTEAERLANQYKDAPIMTDLTVGEAVKGYIDVKQNVLSPATHRAYMSIYNTHFKTSLFGSLKLSSLNNIAVQRFISDLDLNPKTVRNIKGLLMPSIEMYAPNKHFKITLPATKQPELYTPTNREVGKLINAVKEDRELYICVLLYAFGTMRRSEICAVKYDDIDYKENTITVRRAVVLNHKNEWIYKDIPKTQTSYRTVNLPSEVVTAIGRGFGYIITECHPNTLSDRFSAVRDEVCLPHFRMHDLRHYSASILHSIGIPDQYIMSRGGWATDHVMKRVYRDTLTDVDKRMNRKAVRYFEKRIAK